jgi:hypothetical protein
MMRLAEADALLRTAGAFDGAMTGQQRRRAGSLLQRLLDPVMDDEDGRDALSKALAGRVAAGASTLTAIEEEARCRGILRTKWKLSRDEAKVLLQRAGVRDVTVDRTLVDKLQRLAEPLDDDAFDALVVDLTTSADPVGLLNRLVYAMDGR